MGLTCVNLTLSHPPRPDIQPVEAESLADSGSTSLIIPDHVRVPLDLPEHARKEAALADGSRQLRPYVGPVKVSVKNRTALGGAVVMGNEVLLGAIPMEDMDLIVVPLQRRVDVNPQNPNFSAGKAKEPPAALF